MKHQQPLTTPHHYNMCTTFTESIIVAHIQPSCGTQTVIRVRNLIIMKKNHRPVHTPGNKNKSKKSNKKKQGQEQAGQNKFFSRGWMITEVPWCHRTDPGMPLVSHSLSYSIPPYRALRAEANPLHCEDDREPFASRRPGRWAM